MYARNRKDLSGFWNEQRKRGHAGKVCSSALGARLDPGPSPQLAVETLSAWTYTMQSEPCVGKVKLLAEGKMDGVEGRWVETLGRRGLEEP